MSRTKTDSDIFEIAATQFEGIKLLFEHIDARVTERLVRALMRAKRVFVTGRGRSSLLTGWFAMRLMQMGFDVHVPGEVTCPRITKGDLLVAISCSGITTTTVDLARIARESKAKVIAITAIAESALAGTADDTVVLPVTDKDIMKCYKYGIGPCNNTLFEQAMVLYFDSIVYAIIEREGISKAQISKRHTNLE